MPNGSGQGAVLVTGTAAPVTVTLTAPVTVGSLLLGNTSSNAGYTLSGIGGNSLTLDSGGAGTSITIAGGTHAIAVPIILAGSLAVSGSGILDVVGSGSIASNSGSYSVSVNMPTGMLVLGSSDSYTGATTVSQGTLQLANPNSLANSTVSVNARNGLQFNSGIGTFNVGGLAGNGAFSLSDTSGVAVNLVVGGNDQNTTFGGSIGGPGLITKAGSGSIDLTGSNSWTGGLTIDPGTVGFNSDTALGAPSSPIIVLGSGTLQADGPISLSASRSITINSDATASFDPQGNTLTVRGLITGGGTLAKTGSGLMVLTGSNDCSGGTEVLDGTLEVANPNSLADGSNLSLGYGLSKFALVAAISSEAEAVPEPPALGLFSAGSILAAVAACRPRWRDGIKE